MANFCARPSGREAERSLGEDWRVCLRARSVEEAASRVLRRVYGRRVWVERVTGTAGKSGVFQAYKDLRSGGAT